MSIDKPERVALRRAVLLAIVLASGAACRPAAAPSPVAPPSTTTLGPAPGFRMPRTFLPSSYQVRLAIDPAQPRFAAHMAITGALTSPTHTLWLHARDLTVTAAVAVTGGTRTRLEVVAGKTEVIALRAPVDLASGPVELELDYTGASDEHATEGVFRRKIDGAWYAFTQFESTAARRAFPCIDEPDIKVPWQLTLEVPAALLATSNTPIVSDTPRGAKHTVTFARTRPLPSYLVAFAVGPFDVVDAPPTRAGVPVRIVVPHGQAAAASGARDDVGPLVARLEDYLGSPYPYDKLDIVAVPEFPGAMENAGLITFAQPALLEDPRQPTLAHRKAFAIVAAHELAHQWFGDMVTMAWWDDIWLNEGFATWMSAKIVDGWQPGWGGAFAAIDERAQAMAADRLAAARAIRQPIADAGDIDTAFDAITYQKGAAILRMFERWLGADAFQRGIRAYLTGHAWGNATSRDFLAALDLAAGRDVASPFASFLDQAGTPLVSFSLRCSAGAPPVVALTQERYRPAGGSDATPRAWQVPVCVRYAAGAASASDCALLGASSGELPLTHTTGCPAWVMPDADGLGYYRVAVDGDLQQRLLAHLQALSASERYAIADEVDAVAAAGRGPASDVLALASVLARDADRHVVDAAVAITARAGEMIDEAQRAGYRRFVRRVFGARARTLGWIGKPGDSEDTRALRANLVAFVADDGDDPALVAGATALAWAWLDNRAAAPAEVGERAVTVLARRNDTKLHGRLVAELRRTTDASERARVMSLLGQFSDPALVAVTLGLVLDGTVGLFDSATAFFGDDHTPAQRQAIYEAVKAHYDVVVKQLPEQFASQLSVVGFVLCDPAQRDDVIGFFRAKLDKLPGGARTLAQGIERMDVCLARREAARSSLAAYLAAGR